MHGELSAIAPMGVWAHTTPGSAEEKQGGLVAMARAISSPSSPPSKKCAAATPADQCRFAASVGSPFLLHVGDTAKKLNMHGCIAHRVQEAHYAGYNRHRSVQS